ncbi:MAG: PhoX family phosphatase [Betaproteobacteria bacterium]|nr:PhoX family phosphatase [Betaproteobacteria bacterium]
MHLFDDHEPANPAAAAGCESPVTRRAVLKAGLAAAVLAAFGPLRVAAAAGGSVLGFNAVPVSGEDTVRVPAGYSASVLYRWGDPTGSTLGQPVFRPDASNSAEQQLLQAGMHHDGMHFFPLPRGSDSSTHGLLVVNHEYTDDGLLHPDGMKTWTADKVRKSQAAHGVSVIEIELESGSWRIVSPSRYARRICAFTPMTLAGPAAGDDALKTAADPTGRAVLGTFNNCSHGVTPWGTYLASEENFNFYFAGGRTITPEMGRYGITRRRGLRWHEHDARFDCEREPNEANRFGWMVEIDPWDAASKPVKRTALGRFKHEGAALAVAPDGRVVYYMGDDEAFEYIYKFVSARPWHPQDRAANRTLLDHGTLHVARFGDDGRGTWLPLVHGENGLTAANGFASQADVLRLARSAADRVGATPMDRPEWIAVDAGRKHVYCSLTNNAKRGDVGNRGADAANPRRENVFGHIVRWREAGGDPTATSFEWDIFLLAGDPAQADPAKRGNIRGDAFGSPDGLYVDPRGVLWIETDVTTRTIGRGDYANLGNNQMLAADPATGEVRRFLTGPNGCEITGATQTPDGRTMFVNIQHPGEAPDERGNPDHPDAVSSWPDGGRPRSATIVIRKNDGGVIGT